jgi:hypothetical protein
MKRKMTSATEILARLRSREECLMTKLSDTKYIKVDLASEAVNHPNHYQGDGYEVLDIIDDFDLNFNLGNVLKYVLRAGKKDPELKKEDLEKALFYLQREVDSDQ